MEMMAPDGFNPVVCGRLLAGRSRGDAPYAKGERTNHVEMMKIMMAFGAGRDGADIPTFDRSSVIMPML